MNVSPANRLFLLFTLGKIIVISIAIAVVSTRNIKFPANNFEIINCVHGYTIL